MTGIYLTYLSSLIFDRIRVPLRVFQSSSLIM